MNASTYFKAPFQTLVRPKQLTEYTVINIEPISEHDRHKFAGQGALSKKVSFQILNTLNSTINRPFLLTSACLFTNFTSTKVQANVFSHEIRDIMFQLASLSSE